MMAPATGLANRKNDDDCAGQPDNRIVWNDLSLLKVPERWPIPANHTEIWPLECPAFYDLHRDFDSS
jgi:hypothetical protein